MSRIGRREIPVPAGVTVTIGDGNAVTVKGPKGTLSQNLHGNMIIKQEGDMLIVTRPNDNKENRSLHGLTRTLLSNMVVGVTETFTKELEINGVGYRAAVQGKDLVMNIGYSYQVVMTPPDEVAVECPAANRIVVRGCDKQKVGQFAAEVRKKRPPLPWASHHAKGIKYANEYVRRKEGKAGGKKK